MARADVPAFYILASKARAYLGETSKISRRLDAFDDVDETGLSLRGKSILKISDGGRVEPQIALTTGCGDDIDLIGEILVAVARVFGKPCGRQRPEKHAQPPA
jgi:hypothetical protein